MVYVKLLHLLIVAVVFLFVACAEGPSETSEPANLSGEVDDKASTVAVRPELTDFALDKLRELDQRDFDALFEMVERAGYTLLTVNERDVYARHDATSREYVDVPDAVREQFHTALAKVGGFRLSKIKQLVYVDVSFVDTQDQRNVSLTVSADGEHNPPPCEGVLPESGIVTCHLLDSNIRNAVITVDNPD